MAWVPFASLSISKFVGSVGADVGFASIIGLAALALLSFAGARETRTLREQLDDAHNRIAGLEVRLSQVLRGQANRTAPTTPSPAGAPVVPAPAIQSMGSAVAQVRRQAAPGQPTAISGVQTAVTGGAAWLGATPGVGAPALGSATKLIPSAVAERDDPVALPAGVGAPRPTVSVGAPQATAALVVGGATATASVAVDDEQDLGAADTLYVPASTAAANGVTQRSAAGGNGTALPPVPAPPPRGSGALPRVQINTGEDDFAGIPPRRTIPTVPAEEPSAPRRFAGRLVPILLAAGAVVAIVVVLLLITQSGKAPVHTATAKTPTAVVRKKVFDPASVKVSVLNGTGATGLAGDVGRILTQDGYTVPAAAITNAAAETETSTSVQYRPGFSADAKHVAASLSKSTNVSVTSIAPASQQSIVSCGTPTSTGAEGSCPADVIVVVGTDLAGVGSGTS